MGLDMYLHGHNCDNLSHHENLGYWRKHPNLHGFIVNNFANGIDDCRPIELSSSDIEKIIEAVEQKNLPQTTGFFFGSSDHQDDIRTLNIFQDILEKMRKHKNFRVTYLASW